MMGQTDTTNGTTIPAMGYPSDDDERVDGAPKTDRDVSVLERLVVADVAVAEELQSVELAFARALRRSVEDGSPATLPFASYERWQLTQLGFVVDWSSRCSR